MNVQMVRLRPLALMSPWRSRIARLLPKQQVARSNRAGDTVTHISPAREAVRKSVVARFNSGVRLSARR